MAALRHDSLILPANLRRQLASEARAAFPRECCGLIEGVRSAGTTEAVRLHPARNLAQRADRFEIDPMEQFRLLRALRDCESEIVGCYHSHPNGSAVPSATDRERASEEGFIWLIAGVDAAQILAMTAHVFEGDAFRALSLVSPEAAGA